MHVSKARHLKATRAYKLSPKSCKTCSTKLTYEKRYNKFCDRTCAARFNKNRLGTGKPPRKCRRCKSPTSSYWSLQNTFCDSCIKDGQHLHRKELSDIKSEGTRKKYLLRTRSHRCEACRRTKWQGKPIPLEMDHIDGNSDKNTEKNLRLICPNCHALSPYSKGKNRGRGRTRQKTKNLRYRQGLKY